MSHSSVCGPVLHTMLLTIDDLKGASAGTDQFHVNAFHEATDVKFGILSDGIMQAYIATGEPM